MTFPNFKHTRQLNSDFLANFLVSLMLSTCYSHYPSSKCRWKFVHFFLCEESLQHFFANYEDSNLIVVHLNCLFSQWHFAFHNTLHRYLMSFQIYMLKFVISHRTTRQISIPAWFRFRLFEYHAICCLKDSSYSSWLIPFLAFHC